MLVRLVALHADGGIGFRCLGTSVGLGLAFGAGVFVVVLVLLGFGCVDFLDVVVSVLLVF